MRARRSSLLAGVAGVVLALALALVWWGRHSGPVTKEPTIDAITQIRITRHDSVGAPLGRPVAVRDPRAVRSLIELLSVDELPEMPCPPDYGAAELGLLLTGGDVYVRRNVYLFALSADGGAPLIVVVSSAGCRGGPPRDVVALRRAVDDAGHGGS